MSKTIRRTIDPKVLKGHPLLNMSPRAIMEPRKDTNRHERKIQNHEWTRMDTNGKLRTTNGHEIHERRIQNH